MHWALATPLRVRKWTWREIDDLRVETDGNARGSAPRHRAWLYDSAGRRISLPNVNERFVADLRAEVEVLRGIVAAARRMPPVTT
ncbi:hypothetical protein [Streptomyces sp. NPDC020298]|uniref:hypothetical protein n=1 Tax=unclassified Streptomyces TaxID=2593676 RepID=UPI0033CA9056